MVNSPQTKQRSMAKNGMSGGSGDTESKQGTSSTTWTKAQIMETFRKSLKTGSEWPDKDELLDVVYWGRQILGALIGLLWGLIPFYGILGLGVYLAISTAVMHVYVTTYQRQDEEQYGGFWELAKEGFGSAFATFVVCWILVYTAVHFDSVS